ncbi:MAG: hypothetical protein DRO15_06885 [Thermoprotei archaeon]|nr:MAG: hypothetical protein DRO15_06885 [Thermoprotei archaeon]
MGKRLWYLKKAIEIGTVTKRYPFEPTEPPEGSRGKPVIDFTKCIGCGACANVCTPQALRFIDLKEYKRLELFYGRCIFCGMCQEACPVDAIQLTKDFELATDDLNDLYVVIELKSVRCEICNKYFTTKRIILKINDEVRDVIEEIEYTKLCPECRRKESSTKLVGWRALG